jgi:hypothetical protein
MARRFKRRQALENERFLAALRRTGNARLAARELGVHRSTYTKRRAGNPAFAAEWDAALALAHARLNNPPPPGEGDHARHGGGAPRHPASSAGEPAVIRLRNGRLQLRAPGARRIGRPEQQAFLAALSATANVRLAARAAGFAHSSFYRLRDHNPAFAREMRLALRLGYERIEMALIESFAPESARDDAWRTNDPPSIPPMTAGEALQLLYLHQKEARLWAERPDRRRRRGEATDAYSARLARKWRAEQARDREDREVARAVREGGEAPPDLEPPAPWLSDLSQVTGWSKARPDARRPREGDPALFGGWRLKDWEG